MNFDRDVVITGIGVVSPIGIGADAFWDSLATGKSGVSVRPAFADTDLPLKIAAPVQDFDGKLYIKPRKAMKIMCAPIQFGCAAAAMAFEQAQLADSDISPDRIGTLFGTETFFADPREVADVFRHCTIDQDYQHDKWGEFAMRKIQPLWMLKYLPNMAASHISISIDARGHSNSICQGSASGLIALIEAARVIQRGACDVVVTGGTGSQMELTSLLYRGYESSALKFADPTAVSRPMEKNRGGVVAGEGAGAIVLESAEHAARRGATPLAKLAGWSQQFRDPHQPDFQLGIGSCFHSALAASNLKAANVGCVNADAAGSIKSDPLEAAAIEDVFGDVPVVAHKSNFGNLGPGTSTIELIGAILSISKRQIPPTLNYELPDPACPVNVTTELLPLEDESKSAILKSSISSTGQLASVIIQPA